MLLSENIITGAVVQVFLFFFNGFSGFLRQPCTSMRFQKWQHFKEEKNQKRQDHQETMPKSKKKNHELKVKISLTLKNYWTTLYCVFICKDY